MAMACSSLPAEFTGFMNFYTDMVDPTQYVVRAFYDDLKPDPRDAEPFVKVLEGLTGELQGVTRRFQGSESETTVHAAAGLAQGLSYFVETTKNIVMAPVELVVGGIKFTKMVGSTFSSGGFVLPDQGRFGAVGDVTLM